MYFLLYPKILKIGKFVKTRRTNFDDFLFFPSTSASRQRYDALEILVARGNSINCQYKFDAPIQGGHATTRFLEGFLEGSLSASAS